MGPPLGGAAISLFGQVMAVLADVVSYLLDGWRQILAQAGLRELFFNTMLVNGLVMVMEPLISMLMFGQVGFASWQYGLAFAVPCVSGLIGSRLGQHRVMLTAGTLGVCWPVGLIFIRSGVPAW